MQDDPTHNSGGGTNMSEIPEGATHWGQGHCKFWIKDLRPGISYQFANARNGGGYTSWMIRNGDPLYPITPIASAWAGEGTPPLNVEFEWRYGDMEWKKGEALYIGEIYAILKSTHGGEQHYYLRDMQFRPIRTPEQIAAEERERDIATLTQLFCADGAFDVDDPEVGAAITKIYDAGYRKTDVQ